MKEYNVIKYFSHPLLLAAVLTLFASPLLFKFFPRYYAGITGSGVVSKTDGRILWADLMNDGESEKVEWFNNSEGKATCRIAGQSGFLIDLQIFDGEALVLRNPPAVTDLNRNNFPEIHTFYHRNDSLFFSSFEYPGGKPVVICKECYVVKVPNYNRPKDYDIGYLTFEEYPVINPGELVFTVNAGYPGVPRNVFKYSLYTNDLIRSSFTGAYSVISDISDINSDGRQEYLIGQYAPANLHDTLIEGLNDLSVRLLVLDSRLDTCFRPVEFNDKFTGIHLKSVTGKGETFLVASLSNNHDVERNGTIMVFSATGKLLTEKKLQNSDGRLTRYWIDGVDPDSHFMILNSGGSLQTYDLSLEKIRTKKIPEHLDLFGKADINQDNIEEWLFYHSDPPYILISESGCRHPVKVKLPQEQQFLGPFHLKKNHDKHNEISLQAGNQFLLISYGNNPFFPFRFPALLVIWGFLSGFVFLIQYLQGLALRDKYMAERRISELQLLLIRNQLSPHFLFNAINSVSYRLMERNPEEANKSILRLSGLIRNSLVSADRLSRSLTDELEAVKNYLDIINAQREEPFAFRLDISPETDLKVHVPVMVIQNYVENCVKHGIASMGVQGKINLSLTQKTGFLHISLTDNGVGRKQASESKDKPASTGKGIGLMEQFFKEVNKYNEKKITCRISDLINDDGTVAGTKVNIDIPVNMKYRIYEK